MRPISLDKVMAADLPEPRWAIPGIFPAGVSLLVGAPKVGKSWLLFDACISIALGRPALGGIEVEPGEALYLALEDNLRRLQDRARILLDGDESPNTLHVVPMGDMVPPLPKLAGELTRWIEDHPMARFIAIDVYARIRPLVDGKGPRQSLYETDYAALQPLNTIANNTGVGIGVAHHARKQDSQDFVDMVSGTHGLAGAVDTVAVLSKARTKNDGVLSVSGRDVEERALSVRFESGRWVLLGEESREPPLSETRTRILALIEQQGPMNVEQVSAALNMNSETVRKRLRQLADDHHLFKNPDKTFDLVRVENDVFAVPGIPPIPAQGFPQVKGGDGRDGLPEPAVPGEQEASQVSHPSHSVQDDPGGTAETEDPSQSEAPPDQEGSKERDTRDGWDGSRQLSQRELFELIGEEPPMTWPEVPIQHPSE